MLCAGPRVSEIAHLSLDDLNFERGEIYIYGEKNNQWRTCFMTDAFKVAMKHYLKGRDSGSVFIGKKGKKSVTPATLEKIAKGIAVKAECKVSATVHVYRKTFASREYVRTKDILYVSKR